MARTQKNAQPLTTAQRLSSIVKSCRDIMRKDKGLNGDLDRLPMLTWIMFLKFLDDMEQIAEQEARMAGKRFRPALEAPYRWRDWNPANSDAADGGLHTAMTGDALIAFITQDEAVRPDGERGPGLFAHLRSLDRGGAADRRSPGPRAGRGRHLPSRKSAELRDEIPREQINHENTIRSARLVAGQN